jgi:hypothetical protein
MSGKKELLANLRAAYDAWETLLADRSEAEIAAKSLPAGWSIGDVVAHLLAWQQISIARLEAALRNTEPKLPVWLAGANPFFAEEHTDDFNARIVKIYRDQAWSSVHRTWREGFLRFLDLGAAIPEDRMFDPERFPWLKGYALSAVLHGSYEHHQEHLDALAAAR